MAQIKKKLPTPASSIYGYETQQNESAMQGIDQNYSYQTGEFDEGDYSWKDIYKSYAENYDPAKKISKKNISQGVTQKAPPIPEGMEPDQEDPQ